MEEASLDDLGEELAALEAEETRVSAERRRLHHQIDYGFATETTQRASGRSQITGDSCTAVSTRYESASAYQSAASELLASPTSSK